MSNPGDGSGATGIVPALPSSTRVADIFAFQADGTVQAITSDGTTAWTADASQAVKTPTPDFLGGLVFTEQQNGSSSIVRLDGITGQRHPQGPAGATLAGVHPDGTIFATLDTQGNGRPSAVIGIDPTTGAQKFSVPFDIPAGNIRGPVFDGSFIVAGDGYAYTTYLYGDGSSSEIDHLQLLRVNSSGAHDTIKLADYPIACCPDVISYHAHMITNADTGIVLTWDGNMDPNATASAMAITNGATASVVSAPALPGYSKIAPVLQAQDGSFIGSVEITPDQGSVQNYMIAFDASGNLRWAVPNDQPQIATADGGVIGESGTYDSNGNATGQIATPTYSWPGYAYQVGSVDQVIAQVIHVALSWWAYEQGNQAHTGTAENQQEYPELKSCTDQGGNCTAKIGPRDLIWNVRDDLAAQLEQNTPCRQAAQQYVYGVLKWGFFHNQSIDAANFSAYLRNTWHFYDGTHSTLDSMGTGASGSNPPQTVSQRWFYKGSETTAVTVTPSNPLRTFWQPADASQSGQQVGIDSTTFGKNC